MKKNLTKIALSILMGLSSLYSAGGVELNINNNVVEFQAQTNLNQFYELDNANDYNLNIGILHEDKGAPNLFNVGVSASTSEFDAQNVEFGLGIGLVASSTNSNTFMALPFSLNVSAHINEKLLIEANGAYSPSVLSFGKAEKFTSTKVTLNYQLLNNGYVFVGLRNIKATYTDNIGTIKYDDSAFVGYRVKF
jgi:hypothetical protein